MDKARVLRAMFAFAFAFAALFSCSESGGGNSKTPAEEKAENAVGKTNDGHDVVVFNPGDLEEVLFKIDTVYITDTSFSGRMFFRNLPASKTPEPGDIINSTIAKNAPSGFLYRVAEVTKESEDVTIVSVGYASIAEAVKDAEIEFTIPLVYDENGGRPVYVVVQGEEDGQALQFLAKKKCGWNPLCGLAQAANWVADEIKPVTDAIDGFVRFVITGDAQVDTQTSAGIGVNKKLSIPEKELGPFKAKGGVGVDGSYTIWLTMKMKIEDYRFEHFKIVAGHAKDFKLKGDLEGKVEAKWEEELFNGYLGSIVIPIAGIVITLDNSAIVKAKLEASATAKMEAGITLKETNEYGVEYTRGKGWEKIDSHDKKSDYYYKHSIYGEVRLGILVGLKTTINGSGIGIDLLAGPSLVVKNDMLSGDLKKGLWSDPKITLDADVDFEMNIRLGFLEKIAKEFKDGCNLAWLRIPQGNLMKNEVMPGIYFTADTKTSFTSESKTPSDWDLKEIDKGKLSFKFTTRKSGALGFSVKEAGFCAESKKGECVKGPGRGEGKLAKVAANAGNYEGYEIGSGYNDNFTASFEDLAPGTYNIVPYFKALDDEIYYDTAGAVKNFVVGNYCGSGNQAFDPETQFCSGGSVYDKCGGNAYDPATQFCASNAIYDKCNGSSYDPSAKFCWSNALYDLCGGRSYNPSTEFCSNKIAYPKCDGKSYAPSEGEQCCGTKIFNMKTQVCSSGNEVIGRAGGLFIDPRDGQSYRTTVIGTQTWLAENLKYDAEGSRCYDDEPLNCVLYGRYYDWSMAMALPSSCNSSNCSSQINNPHQGICPEGWHIPSGDEWGILIDYAENDKTTGDESAGRKLKATISWDVLGVGGPSGGTDYGAGTDKYEFSALAGGFRLDSGIRSYATWWSTPYDGHSGYDYYQSVFRIFPAHSTEYNSSEKGTYLNIRCLKD